MTRSLFKDSRRPYFWCERALLRLGCNAIEIALYCVLADCVNEKDCCWPSYATLAEGLAISRRTAMRGIKRLCERGAVHKSTRTNPQTGKSINIYELVDLPGGSVSTRPTMGTGDTTVTGDSPDTPPVTPVSPHWCHKVPSNKDPLNKEPRNEGGAPARDALWDGFATGFQQRYGHRPHMTPRQKADWMALLGLHPADLVRAKIDAWWDFPCPRLTGNRPVGTFLQWFDDIPVNGSGPLPGRVLTEEELKAELHAGTPLGRQEFRGLAGTLEEDAQIKVLLREGFAHDENDARTIIAACTTNTGGA